MTTKAYAAFAADQPLAPYSFERRKAEADDVTVQILYCGVCHSDLHWARNDWGWSHYPVVPGHEIIGRVTSVGSAVTRRRCSPTWPAKSGGRPALGKGSTVSTGASDATAVRR